MNALKDIHPIPGSPALSHINSDAESSSVVGYFEMTKNGQVLSSFSISLGKAYVLGRSEDCDLTLDDRAISRQHVMVEYDESQQCVKVSKKSEFARLLINGLECFEGVMKSNDTMVLGPYQLRFVLKQKEIISVKEAEAKPVVIQKMDSKADQNRELASDANLQELNSNPAGAYTHSIEDPFGIETAMQDAESPNVESLNAESLAEVVNLNDHKIDDHAEEDENIQQDHDQGLAVSDDATKVLKKAVTAQLVLIQGSANHEALKLKNNEMIIGRGKQCQLIVDDKKASRKNTKITREGNRFIVEDLNSSNGTYVNQEKINGPHELSGGDVIRIGQVELRFEAEQRDYANQVANFEPITAEALPVAHDGVESFSGLDSMSMEQPLVDGMIPGAFDSESADLNPEVSGKKQSLIDKYIRNFKTLPTKKKLIVGAVIALLVYGFVGEDPQPVKKKSAKVDPKTGQVLKAQARTFESLSEKDKQFVIDQHAQGSKYYALKDYSRSVVEIKKVFEYVDNYLNSKEILELGERGKLALDRLEEEKKRIQKEQDMKRKINELVEQTQGLMDAKNYDEAIKLFPEIVTLDPENIRIDEWKKEIEEYRAKIAAEQHNREVRDQINAKARESLEEGQKLYDQARYHKAIDVFTKTTEIGASDKSIVDKAIEMAEQSRLRIQEARDPTLAEAKQLESSGDLASAYKKYEQATEIDPPHPEGWAGMARIKDVLNDKAKVLYTEAIIAANYSDFDTAYKKYEEIIRTAPKDSVYHQRAERKIASLKRSNLFNSEGAAPTP